MSEHRRTEVVADLLGLPLLEPRVADIDRALFARMNLRRAQECVFIPVSQAGGRVANSALLTSLHVEQGPGSSSSGTSRRCTSTSPASTERRQSMVQPRYT